MAKPQSDEPFFIVGSDRSGTTMFRLMLNKHPRLHVPNESWFLIDLMDHLPASRALNEWEKMKACRLIMETPKWKGWQIADELLVNTIKQLQSPTLAGLIDALFRLDAGTKPRWGDKTPGYVTQISRLHKLFPEAKFVHLIRDGRDVCVSLRRTGWRGRLTWGIGNYWKHHVDAGWQQGLELPAGHYMEIRYEHLVADPESVLREVCAFLEEDFEPAMLDFYRDAWDHITPAEHHYHEKAARPPSQAYVNRWKTELSPWQTRIFEAAAASTLDRLGYRRRFRGRLVGTRVTLRVLAWAAQVSLPFRRKIGLHFPRLRKQL